MYQNSCSHRILFFKIPLESISFVKIFTHGSTSNSGEQLHDK